MMLKSFDQAQLLFKNPQSPHAIYNREWEALIENFLFNAPKKISPLTTSVMSS